MGLLFRQALRPVVSPTYLTFCADNARGQSYTLGRSQYDKTGYFLTKSLLISFFSVSSSCFLVAKPFHLMVVQNYLRVQWREGSTREDSGNGISVRRSGSVIIAAAKHY